MNQLTTTKLAQIGTWVWQTMCRQLSLPSPLRALAEITMFSGVFLVAGKISLGVSLEQMLWPMLLIVGLMMLSMVVSGVYRSDITNSIMNIYVHSAFGFFISTILFLITVAVFLPDYSSNKFVFFFLFFSFFVTNTVRPLISGTDFMDGGGRRTN